MTITPRNSYSTTKSVIIMNTSSEGPNSIYSSFLNKTPYAANYTKDRKAILTQMYMRKLSSACISRFKWCGLPSEIDERFLEVTLHFRGLCVFTFEQEFNKFMAYRAQGNGQLDWYDNPLSYTCYANNLKSRVVDSDDCVPIWSNVMRVPDHDLVNTIAARIAEFDVSIDQLVVNTRHPVLLVADDQTRNSVMALWRQLQEGQPFIGTHKGFGQDIDEFVKAFDLGVNANDIPTLQIAKTRVFNEFMGFMGVNNANQDKRERLVSDEVSANNSQVGIFRADALAAREYACQLINDRYSLNLSVEWNERPVDDMGETEPSDYGEDDE